MNARLFCCRFDDTWLLDYDVNTLCPGQGCQVRLTWDLIKHFVWFDNPQSHIRPQDFNTTRDCFLNAIPVDQIIFPLEWIWFENDERLNFEEEEISGLLLDYNIVPDVREDDQDLIYLDQTEKNRSLLNLFSDSPG